MLIITILMVLISSFSSINLAGHKVEAELDPASKIICKFEDGQTLVNFYSTDYFHFLFRSKSAVTSLESVNSSWLNKLLSLSGFDFNETNEAILGRPLNPSVLPEESTSEANESAPKVSAFDRFGVAGLKWSSYQGEWKYHHVEACASQDSVSPTTYGTFYEGRLEPKSTHNETPTSVDPRSIQFNKGVGSSLATAFTDTISNAMFSITKGIVTLTIVFVGLAFTDITSMFGMLNDDGTSGATASGVFSDLFDGIFSGFILFTFVLTGLVILYRGLIKRELRFALNTLIKTILIFIVAIIMASNPSYWIGMPNKIATYGQALVLSSMSGIYEDDSEAALCTTEVASIEEGVNLDLSKPDSFKDEFERTNENMRSMIGCKMWETLLFKPWVRGQFGAEFEDLSNEQLGNSNESWVGTAAVPVGNGEEINNWALFHLSTQTDAHAPQSAEGIPVLINGVNSDWWRVVDAVSDYEEEVLYEDIEDGGQQEFSVPVKKDPTNVWQSWVGNNRTERLGIAFISIVFGIVGSIAPLVFGVASAVYGLGITLLMMTAPIFLLFGTWGGRGDGIFLGWLSALANTIIKKIGAGILLILSLSFSMIIMDMIGEIGFIKSFILMVLVSSLLIKNKDKILDIMAGIDFGGAFDPRTKANQFLDVQKKAAKQVTSVGAAAVAGSVAAHETGQNIFSGARVGVQRQLRNQLYTSSTGMNIIRQADIAEGGERIERHTCITCHMPLGVNKSETAYRDDDGNYFCMNCADEMGVENLYEIVVGQDKVQESNNIKEILANKDRAPVTPDKIRSIDASLNKSWMSHRSMRESMDSQLVDGEYYWNNEAVQVSILSNIKSMKRDYVLFSNIQMKIGRLANPPSPPEPLHEYIDLGLINKAWLERRFDIVEATYKEAWKLWYADNGEYVADLTEEDIAKFQQRIEELDGEVNEEAALKDLEKFLEDTETGQSHTADRDIYIYVNGKLVLNNTDITDVDDRLSN